MYLLKHTSFNLRYKHHPADTADLQLKFGGHAYLACCRERVKKLGQSEVGAKLHDTTTFTCLLTCREKKMTSFKLAYSNDLDCYFAYCTPVVGSLT